MNSGDAPPPKISVHSEVTNSHMMSGDSGVEEVYRRRTLSTSDQVEHNFGCVGQPNLNVNQWRRQNFSAAGAQPGHQNLDWGTFKKLCVPSLFLVEASSYTVRTNGGTHKIVFVRKW